MMIRLDFSGAARPAARAMRVAFARSTGIALLAEPGPRLPFRGSSIDELFVGRAVAWRTDIAETLDEFWRVSKPGALIHLTLPHASSTFALSRDPRPRPLLTLNTFNFYDPRSKPPDAPPTAFTVERARLRVAGERNADSGLALARGPLASFIEKIANGSRGSQYRFERWFANVIGFEEFDVVLSVVKPPANLHATAPREMSGVAGQGGRVTVETRRPDVDLTYSIHDFEAGTHGDSLFLYQAIEDTMIDLASEVRSGRVLDVACGTGKLSMRIEQRGCYSVGAEASMEMIGLGRYVHPESRAMMVRSIAETLPFADATFDRVICQGSLDHFADAQAFMREAARILKPEGRVVIALANFESLSCRLGRSVDRLKRRLGRPPPPWRPYWIIPDDHNVRGDLPFVHTLGAGALTLERVRGVSLLWLFSRYGQLLDALPRPAARAVWRSLDWAAWLRPRDSDMIISVWCKRGQPR